MTTWMRSTECDTGNCVEIAWVRACESAACVEAANLGDTILVRDSKNPGGKPLSFDRAEWRAFVAGVKNGQFDFA